MSVRSEDVQCYIMTDPRSFALRAHLYENDVIGIPDHIEYFEYIGVIIHTFLRVSTIKESFRRYNIRSVCHLYVFGQKKRVENVYSRV